MALPANHVDLNSEIITAEYLNLIDTTVNDHANQIDVIQTKPGVFAATGAVPDLLSVIDAHMVSGSATLSSITAAFVPSDEGKLIYVRGAGVAGVQLASTILAYINASTITLSASASTTITLALAEFGTDNRLAIQAAIDAAHAYGGGVGNGLLPGWDGTHIAALGTGWGPVITLLPGAYLVTPATNGYCLTIEQDYLTLQSVGGSHTTIIQCSDANYTGIVGLGITSNTMRVGCSIYNLVFQGDNVRGENTGTGHGMIANANALTMRNVTIQNVNGNCCQLLAPGSPASPSYITMFDCVEMYSPGSGQDVFVIGQNIFNCEFRRCQFGGGPWNGAGRGTGRHGVNILGACSDLKFELCHTFELSGCGYNVGNAGGAMYRLAILGGEVESSTLGGINLFGVQGAIIQGVTGMYGNEVADVLAQNCSGVTISNNFVGSAVTGGGHSKINLFQCDHSIVANNQIAATGDGANAIGIGTCTNSIVNGNQISASVGTGFSLGVLVYASTGTSVVNNVSDIPLMEEAASDYSYFDGNHSAAPPTLTGAHSVTGHHFVV
jgi:hypothetical protein